MKKRIPGILLVTVMVLSLLPVTALAGAVTGYPLWIEGIHVTDANKTDILGDADGSAATVSFDPLTSTLTLNSPTDPQAGDAGTAALWCILLAVSCAGFAFTKRRKSVR